MDLILRKLRQDTRTSQAYRSHQQTAPLRMYNCGTCGEDHPTDKCRVTNPLKWCEYCRKMMNCDSNECYYRPGYVRGGNNTQMQNENNLANQNNMGTRERARLVLGSQPTPPRTTAFRYVEDQGPSLELVPITLYYVEEPQQSQPYVDLQINDHNYEGFYHMVSLNAHTLMLMANGAFKKPKGYNNNMRSHPNPNYTAGSCFKCQGDHWMRDFPIEQEEKAQARATTQSWPRVSRYCVDCGVDHLSNNCLGKAAEKPLTPTSLGLIDVIPSPSSSKNESEPTPLLVVNHFQPQQAKKAMD